MWYNVDNWGYMVDIVATSTMRILEVTLSTPPISVRNILTSYCRHCRRVITDNVTWIVDSAHSWVWLQFRTEFILNAYGNVLWIKFSYLRIFDGTFQSFYQWESLSILATTGSNFTRNNFWQISVNHKFGLLFHFCCDSHLGNNK